MLNSYSLIFFSLNTFLACSILLVTFFSPFVGLCGFVAVLLTNLLAYIAGFDREEIAKGSYGFNALLLGLSLGYEFNFNLAFVVLFLTAVFILLLITSLIKGFLATYKVPFLSFPFLITTWIISLSASNLAHIELDENHVFAINEAIRNQSSIWYQLAHCFDDNSIPTFINTYLRTLSGTFFQNTVLGGMIIAFGLLYFSRIAFSLSILGFSSAYLFYMILGADISDLEYNLHGSNFIFLAIAIGCFFLIPNKFSYLAVLLLTPVMVLTLLCFSKIVGVFQLKAYSLSFTVICIGFIYALQQRWLQQFLHVVTVQYFSAEKTIYKYLNSIQRFKNEHYYKISLPFSGEWFVSQGYNGGITHLGDWSKALDFVIIDSKSNTYREPALNREHFYCYNKEILAPFDGYIYDIINNVQENDIGEVNTERNWGNTVIINHLNGVFSQISHIKKDSFKVFIGQFVTKGTLLATCGNSGRSPEPHIHFQMQTVATLGAKTLAFPISYFIERNGLNRTLKISEIPTENTSISNIKVNEILVNAFAFYPGLKITFQNEKTKEYIYWEILTDAWNRTYIRCKQSQSLAYFVNDGTMLYFTDFEGDNTSLLFSFYLASYRQLLGYYDNVEIKDNVPLIHFNAKIVQFFQDFVAPFYLFTHAEFKSKFTYSDNIYAPQHIIIQSEVHTKVLKKSFKKSNFELEIKNHKIQTFTVHHKHKSEQYSCVYSY